MVQRTHRPDPLDAVLAGDDRAEVRDLAVFVGDLRTAYVPTEPLERSPELAALTDRTRPASSRRAVPARRRYVAFLGAVLASLTGKLVLGGAVAAATIGGLHATETVDVPLLPDVGRATDPEVEVDTPAPAPALPDHVDLPGAVGGTLPAPDVDGPTGDVGPSDDGSGADAPSDAPTPAPDAGNADPDDPPSPDPAGDPPAPASGAEEPGDPTGTSPTDGTDRPPPDGSRETPSSDDTGVSTPPDDRVAEAEKHSAGP